MRLLTTRCGRALRFLAIETADVVRACRRAVRAWLRPVSFRRDLALSLVILEGLITAAPFLLSWWVSATYRSVLAGWAVSGMKTGAKRKALRSLMGEGDDDTG